MLVAVAPAVRVLNRTGPCREDPERWYTTDPGEQQAVIGVCLNECPSSVAAKCLRDAMTDETGVAVSGRHGIRGGCTPKSRADLDPMWFHAKREDKHCA